jgi:tetratricopeptide (TPR) repeat protein/tRNA A-37 threonylcarbamoyl transferase component Bud32
VQFVFTDGIKRYIFNDGKVEEYFGKLKTKDDIIGYLATIDGDKIKLSKFPIYDCSKIIFEGKLTIKVGNLGYLFESNESLCLFLGNIDTPVINGNYLIIKGIVIISGNKRKLLDSMDNYDVIQYALSKYPSDDEVIRQAIIGLSKLGKCSEAISLYTKLDKKYPEESLAVAECYEKIGEELEALKIYSFFSDERYKILEEKLRKKVDKIIEEYDATGNAKILYNALSILPTYDAPALKLGWHFIRKNPEESIKFFEEAVKRSRSYHNLLMLANAYIKSGKYMEALKIIEEAEKMRRTAGSAFLRGLALENLNAKSEAEKDFLYACKEGIVEACEKVKPGVLYSPRDFYPEQWIGYVIYGYEVKQVLGTGGMGYVLLVERLGKKYAMKIMKKEYNFDEMLNEVAKMQEISKNSKYLVRILANFIDENWVDYYSSPPAIVMEYMGGGDLRDVLAKDEYSTLRHSVLWPQVVSVIFSKLANAIITIHKEGYIHCDIKPSNILFTSPLPNYGEEALEALEKEHVIPKLSDLGSAVKIGTPVIHYTPYYAHPLQRFGQRASTEMDIYSFTVSLYASLTNNFPFPEWLERELEEAVTNPSKREQALKDFYSVDPRMDYVPEEFKDIIMRGLRGEITMEEIARDLKDIAITEYNIPEEVLI